MKIVITGGLGFVGRRLSTALLKDKNSIYLLDRNCSSDVAFCHPCNLDNLTQALSLLHKIKPEVIIHLAGSHKPESAIISPNSYIKKNVAATLNILHYISKSKNRPKIVFASSAGALYTSGATPYTEKQEVKPLSSYGITKVLEENLIKYYAGVYGFSYQILRFSNIYGPGQEKYKHPSIVPSIILNLLKGRPVQIYGDGKQVRDFLFIDDAVAAIVKTLKLSKNFTFNVSSGEGISVGKLHDFISNKMNKDSKKYKMYIDGPIGVKKSIVSNKLIYMYLKWKPEVSLEDGLKKTIAYLENTPKSTKVY